MRCTDYVRSRGTAIDILDAGDVADASSPVELFGKERQASVGAGNHRVGEESTLPLRQPSGGGQVLLARCIFEQPLDRHLDQSDCPLLVPDH